MLHYNAKFLIKNYEIDTSLPARALVGKYPLPQVFTPAAVGLPDPDKWVSR